MSNHKIVRLKVANVMRIKAAEVKPDGNLIVVGGKNGEGKTSLIQSIAMALGGADAAPPEPIRQGEERAEVVLELEDLVITRTFTAKGSYLKVSAKDGAVYPGPQKILDKLVGKLTFDPLAFSRMPAKQQAETLRVLAALDFGSADAARAEYYAERTAVNREAKAAFSRADDAPRHADAPEVGVSITGLTDELERAEVQNAQNAAHLERLKDIEADGAVLEKEVDMLGAKIRELQEEVDEHETMRAGLKARWTDQTKLVNSLKDIDTTAIKQGIREAEGVNRQVRENAARKALYEDFKAKDKQAAELTERMDKIDEDKAKALREAKLPIEGLGLSTAGVTFGGLPFEQCSSAEQLRISVAMGMAMNPDLRILMIRDGSLLDKDSRAQVAAMAKDGDYQIWLEVATDGPEGTSVYIEDGMIVGAETPETEAASV